MIKARLTGSPEELEKIITKLNQHFSIPSSGNMLRDRNSKYSRIYIDLEAKKENESSQ